eukprot:683346-Rhodomonas_salina.1
MVRGKGAGPGCVISASLLPSTAPSSRDCLVSVGGETEHSLPHWRHRVSENSIPGFKVTKFGFTGTC